MNRPDDIGRDDAIEFGAVDDGDIRAAIVSKGYYIARQVVPAAAVTAMRQSWLDTFAGDVTAAPVIWGPFMGEPNRVLYHRSETCCMYRAYDFLWNPPIDTLTRKVGVGLSRLRNRITESEPLSGEIMESDRYGIYISTSY